MMQLTRNLNPKHNFTDARKLYRQDNGYPNNRPKEHWVDVIGIKNKRRSKKCTINFWINSKIMKNFIDKLWVMPLVILISMTCNSCKNNDDYSTIIQNQDRLLEKHTVMSSGHPIALWEKKTVNPKGYILFVHGRTWSGIPDFDLQVEGEELSLMDGMVENGYTTYAVDLRGYGATPRDSSEWLSPSVAVKDILTVLEWISEENEESKVHLFGWSMGSTLSILTAQNSKSDHIASLALFGFWKDLDDIIPNDPNDIQLVKRVNTVAHAAGDFITPSSISQNAINTFVKVALESDPIRVDWRNTSEYNAIDPSRIAIPVIVLQGEHDPIAPTARQAKLFTRLKTADKSWVVISGGDHAAFLEKPREHFIISYTNFIDRFN